MSHTEDIYSLYRYGGRDGVQYAGFVKYHGYLCPEPYPIVFSKRSAEPLLQQVGQSYLALQK